MTTVHPVLVLVVQPKPAQQARPANPPARVVDFFPQPRRYPGVPVGLEFLMNSNRIFVGQVPDDIEASTGIERENRYVILGEVGQSLCIALEESDFCNRKCCGPLRGFEMHVLNIMKEEVMRVTRDFKCCARFGCCAGLPCCAMELQVEAPVGEVIGSVRQLMSFSKPRYVIKDARGSEVLYVEGPKWLSFKPRSSMGDEVFSVTDVMLQEPAGKISKMRTDFDQEVRKDSDLFCVQFPLDLDTKMKATLVALVFLIDFMYFEEPQKKQD